jgi:hypothetical protein
MEFFIFWLVFSVVVGIGAAGRGRHGAGWFLLSMVISPLLSFLLLMMLPSRSKSAGAPQTPGAAQMPRVRGADPARSKEVQALRRGGGPPRAREGSERDLRCRQGLRPRARRREQFS